MSVTLEVFSDYVCPWCYLGSARVAALCDDWDIDVRITHFPLHLDTPEEGLPLERLFPGRDVGRMQQDMEMRMRAEGLEYGDRRMTYNSVRAQQLALWAVEQPGGEAIHAALFAAYFVEDVNLADVDELVRIAESVSLDGSAAREAVASRRFRPALSEHWERCRRFGVTGVPTYRTQEGEAVGAQPLDVLQELIRNAGATPR